MNLFYRLLITSILFVLPLNQVLAITIDDFSDSQSVDAAGPGQTSFDSISGTQTLGGTRGIVVETTAGIGNLTVETAATTPPRIQHSHDVGIVGTSTIQWDGDLDPSTLNPAGLGGINIVEDGGTAIILTKLSFDNANSATVTLTVYDASDPTGQTFSAETITLNQVTILQDFTFTLANLPDSGPNGAADFTNVGAIEVRIDGGASVDLSFEKIITNGSCPLIPTAGNSVFDDCGECIPPTDPNYNMSCKDCLGIPNGTTLPGDSCSTGEFGECDAGTYNANCDCEREKDPGFETCDGKDNNCNGEIDETFPLLGESCSDGDGECAVDGEFVCSPNGGLTCSVQVDPADLEDCSPIIGCDGIPGSPIVFDRCGICGGDGSACDECDSQDITETLFLLDGGAKAQEQIVRRITKPLKRSGRKRLRAFVKDIRGIAHDLQIKNWVLAWTIPQVVTSCPDTNTLCVATSNVANVEEYQQRSAELRDLGLQAIKRLRRFRRNNRAARKLRREVNGQHNDNVSLSETVPPETDICG